MAFIKEVTITNGGLPRSASYWKIGAISFDFRNKMGSISVQLYSSKKYAQEAPEDFIETHTVGLYSLEDSANGRDKARDKFVEFFINGKHDNPRAAAYEYLKKYDPFFIDAQSDETIATT